MPANMAASNSSLPDVHMPLLPSRGISYFLPHESGLALRHALIHGSARSDAVPVTSLALKTSDNFCFYSLGTQLPFYKEAQAILLERGPRGEALEEKKPRGGEPRPQMCEKDLLDLLAQPFCQMNELYK